MTSKNLTQLNMVIVGHVDHGKSTLIGRLLYDTDSLPEGKVEELKAISEKRGMDIEWSFVLDAFQAERDQAVTIDTTQIWFKTEKRNYVIIDAPGHREFLKNMISGAAAADAAILVVDADEGVQEQTKRHAYLLHLLGIQQVGVVINKMDLVGHKKERYDEVSQEVVDYLAHLGITARFIVPISARHGDNIASIAEKTMPWYDGETVLSNLDKLQIQPPLVDRPMRFMVQDVYRYKGDERRIIVGRVESGILNKGDKLLFSPSNLEATVVSLEKWNSEKEITYAKAGESMGFTLDKPIFVERGHIASTHDNPPMLTRVFAANIFWIAHHELKEGMLLTAKFGTCSWPVMVQSINKVINTDDLQNENQKQVKRNEMAEVVLRSSEMMALYSYVNNPRTGRLVLFDKYDVVGGGIIDMAKFADQRNVSKAADLYSVEHLLRRENREWRNGHKGAVIWLTGLSGSGKSSVAMEVEKLLFNQEKQVYVLDGDNVRNGLNRDLGFSDEDRSENIRRIGEVAALMADAGMIVITAFISPFKEDRMRARAAAGQSFHEVYIEADLATCEQRDPKGLYQKAREGKIKEFTGISSPYEAPDNPEIVVDTQHHSLEECAQQVLTYVNDVTKV